MKKILLGLLVLTMCVSMAASFSAASPELAPYLEAKIDWRQFEGEKINFIGNVEPNQEAIMGLVPVFEELTGIKVTRELVNEEILRQKTTIDITAKTGVYDLMLVDPTYMPLLLKGEGLEDLGPFFENPKLTDIDWYDWPSDFPEGFLQMGQQNGIQYGIPLHLSGTLMFYRKDLFQEAGIDAPAKTMDELMDQASKLHNPDEEMYGIAMRGMRGAGLNVFIWACFLKSFGGTWFDQNWKPMLDSPEAIESVEFYADILNKYGPPGVSSWEWSKTLAAMQAGNVAIVIDTPAFGISIEDTEKSKTAGLWGYAPQPSGPNGITMDPYSWYMSINKNSKHKEAAWLFLTWMTSKEVQTLIGGPAVYVSRLSVNNDPEWQKTYPWLAEWQAALMENAKYADPDARPRIPEWPEVGDITGAALESVIAQQITAKDAMDDAVERITEVMEEAGYYK